MMNEKKTSNNQNSRTDNSGQFEAVVSQPSDKIVEAYINGGILDIQIAYLEKYGIMETRDGYLCDKKYEPIFWMVRYGILRNPSKKILDEYLEEYKRRTG